MKTAVLEGLDNRVFSAADLLDPKELKLIGFATTITQAWNVYDAAGEIKEEIEELPVMPVEMASGYEPDCIVLAASDTEDEEILKYKIFQADYRGEVISLYDFFRCFSSKTAALRKMAWRLTDLGVEGDAADLGTGHGDVAWQLNALMPDRALYLFDTFTGCDARDTAVEEKTGILIRKSARSLLRPKNWIIWRVRCWHACPIPGRW